MSGRSAILCDKANDAVRFCLVGAFVLAFPIAACGADKIRAEAQSRSGDNASYPHIDSVTLHKGVFGRREISYHAVAGTTILRNAEGKPAASLVSVSYLQTGQAQEQRPVIFMFNGGPGSSSAWLHAGAFGPRRLGYLRPDSTVSAPFAIVDNDSTLLDVADLVFIDPVETGYSRILPDGKAADFLNESGDAASIGAFIVQWLQRYGRWNSPRFMLGESYGTRRAVRVAHLLSGGNDAGHFDATNFNGLILLGQTLSPSSRIGSASDIVYAELLPSLAASARYFGRGDGADEPLEAVLARAEQFAAQEYLPALYRGSSLPFAERRKIAEAIARLTGIPETQVLSADLRISPEFFVQRLLADQGRVLGRYDTRFTATVVAEPDGIGDDPSMIQMGPAIVTALRTYLRGELGIDVEQTYEFINFDLNTKWDFSGAEQGLIKQLGGLAARNPTFRVLFGAGYYDLNTPWAAALYVANHSGIEPGRVAVRGYDAGHMVYYGDVQVRKLHDDVREFIVATLAADQAARSAKESATR